MSDYDEIGFDDDYIGPDGAENFEDYGDVGEERGGGSLESSADEVDKVAAVLLGQDVDTSDVKENKSGFRTHNVDKNTDRPELGSQEAPRQPQQQQAPSQSDYVSPEYHQQREQAEQTIRQAEIAKNRIAEMYQNGNGEISAQEAYEAWEAINQRHMAAEYQRMQAENMGYKRQAMMQSEFARMQQRLGDKFDTVEKQQEVLNGLTDWAQAKGLSVEELRSIDNADAASTIIEAYIAERDLADTKQRLAVAQQQLREQGRKKKRQDHRNRRANNQGKPTGSTVDDVLAILTKSGAI